MIQVGTWLCKASTGEERLAMASHTAAPKGAAGVRLGFAWQAKACRRLDGNGKALHTAAFKQAAAVWPGEEGLGVSVHASSRIGSASHTDSLRRVGSEVNCGADGHAGAGLVAAKATHTAPPQWGAEVWPVTAPRGKAVRGVDRLLTQRRFGAVEEWSGSVRLGTARRGDARPGEAWIGTANNTAPHCCGAEAL